MNAKDLAMQLGVGVATLIEYGTIIKASQICHHYLSPQTACRIVCEDTNNGKMGNTSK
jgi:hypothetical protein